MGVDLGYPPFDPTPKAKGTYVSLVKAAVKEVTLCYDCLEFDTQLNNYEIIKIWQRFVLILSGQNILFINGWGNK